MEMEYKGVGRNMMLDKIAIMDKGALSHLRIAHPPPKYTQRESRGPFTKAARNTIVKTVVSAAAELGSLNSVQMLESRERKKKLTVVHWNRQ